MDHADYKNFLHLSETLHFGRSARALHMSTSALTRAVQRMEEELGHALFVRDRRQVRLSAAGHSLRTFAQRQLAEWDALKASLSADWQSPAGDLHIACTVTACYSVLPRLLAECRRRFPRIALKVNTQDAGRSMQQLEAGEVDLAVVPTREPEVFDLAPATGRRSATDSGLLPAGLHSLPLAQTELVFIAPALPEDFDGALGDRHVDWDAIPLIAPLRGLDRVLLDAWLAEHRARPPIHAEVRGNEAIIAMVSMGSGVALVPELVLEASPMKERVRRLKEPPPRGYTVSLCVSERALRRRAVDAFWTIARQERPTPSPSDER